MKGYGGVEAGSTVGGEPGSQGRDRNEENSHHRVSEWVSGLDSDEDGCECASECIGGGKTEAKADDAESESLADDHAENISGRCSERHADADLGGALTYEGGEDSVDPDCGKDGGDGGENSYKEKREAGGGLSVAHEVVHGFELGDEKTRAEARSGRLLAISTLAPATPAPGVSSAIWTLAQKAISAIL